MTHRALIALAAAWIALPQDPPAPPTGVTAATPQNAQIRIDWSANSPAPNGYNVWRSAVSGGPYSKQNTDLISGLTYLDTLVTIGTPYFYVVRAQNAAGESANSSQVTAVPTGIDNFPPNQPTITSQTRKTRDTTPSTSGTAEPGTTILL